MMFSERLEHNKYGLQHLQVVRVQKPVQFRGFSEYQCEIDRFRRYVRSIFGRARKKYVFSDLSTAELKNVKTKCIRP